MRFTELVAGVIKPRMSVAGYIKVGGKEDRETPRWSRGRGGPYLLPTRYVDPVRFEVTTRQRRIEEVAHPNDPKKRKFKLDRGYARDEAIHGIIGAQPDELNIRLYQAEPRHNLVTHLGFYDGRKWACEGDGQSAVEVMPNGEKVTRGCPCPRLGGKDRSAGICKPRGSLSCWLEDSGQWGLLHRFTTTSWESIGNLMTQLEAFYRSFGTLAWIPLVLRVIPVTKGYKDNKGNRHRTTQPIVTVAVRGNPAKALAAAQRWSDATGQAKQIMAPEEQVELVTSDMREETEHEGEEFFPDAGNRPIKDTPPPRRAASRLAQLKKEKA